MPVSQALSASSVCNASHAVLGIHQGLGSTFQYIFIEQKAPQEQTKMKQAMRRKSQNQVVLPHVGALWGPGHFSPSSRMLCFYRY